MTNNPTFEYEDNIHDEFVRMVNANLQPEESVQSSSQADNEESVSLRVNPTYAQEVQEDPEFSKLLSRYSPEDIISMLSKHTVRTMASPSSPSPSPFHTSSSRPIPRPVTPSWVPISTPIPPPTPLPTPIPPPPSVYPPYVQPTPPAQSESISRSKMEGHVRRLLAESLSLSKPHSLQNYYKLPNAYFPPGFKAPKYRKYDGTTDPQFHLSGFTMDSHRWLYDRVLLVHLFQQSLEGEALRWFTALPASDLVNFDIVFERFISHFSYMATQVPTLPDLVAENMRPDEDFVTFANRWRSMASRADIPNPESQAITMIVTNNTPLLRSILMLSEFPSFAHLYNRARVVQNQIKDSSLQPFFEGKPKGRKAPAAPTTEGVTVNESVSACSQPLRPPNKPYNPPSNPHQFPSHPSRPYSDVPPPSGYTRPGISCAWFLYVFEFWPKANLASRSMDVCVVSASTIWTPTLSPVSNDVDVNFSDLHALQSPNFREQASSPIGELSPTILNRVLDPPFHLYLEFGLCSCANRNLASMPCRQDLQSASSDIAVQFLERPETAVKFVWTEQRGGAPAREDESKREERAEQQAPAPQGPVLPPPPPVDYGVFMQGLVQAMQTQAHTQTALQAQLEAQ
ncbi:hypothetical protein Taro_054649, partial [Colocasia esculenta]|nr:hypothetical protein [Colocasia esculenta]